MPQDLSKLAIWQQGCYNDRVRIWKVDHPNDSQGNATDDVITLNDDNIHCQMLFADNVGDGTDIGRIRAFSLRRATVCNLTVDVACGPDWFIQDITPERPADARFVYRVQEQPACYPTQDGFEMNLKIVTIEHDPHPPPEIV